MKNKYIQKTLQLFAIITLFSVGAFAQNSGALSQKWIPVNLYGKQINAGKSVLELNETEKRITGNAGCNRMFGSFERNGKNIKFAGVGTTKMFCGDENIMKVETDFLRALGETTKFKKNGKSLKFYAGKNMVASFILAKQNAESATKLEDKKWILETINDKAVAQTETVAFLSFDKEKSSAGGNSSCNVFGGTYSVDGANLKISEIISTMRACIEDERINIEREFMNALQNIDRFEIKAGKLYLYQGENRLLTFNGENK